MGQERKRGKEKERGRNGVREREKETEGGWRQKEDTSSCEWHVVNKYLWNKGLKGERGRDWRRVSSPQWHEASLTLEHPL